MELSSRENAKRFRELDNACIARVIVGNQRIAEIFSIAAKRNFGCFDKIEDFVAVANLIERNGLHEVGEMMTGKRVHWFAGKQS